MRKVTADPTTSTGAAEASRAAFVADVQYYLMQQPRQLPSRYLYDALGSALFEAICCLPWYRITRAEMRLLEALGEAIFRRLDPLSTLVELGCGSGEKLVALVESASLRSSPLHLHLIDVSPSALAASSRVLEALDGVHVTTHEAPYEVGLAEVTYEQRVHGRTLALFLGSNIGNFDRPGSHAFLRGVHATLHSGDALLIGADLVKSERELELAYDDPLGVTAAFNRNLLVRINRELGGTFDVGAFAHRVVWNGHESRIEMHLVSRCRQRVAIRLADLDFVIDEGESIWTESSYKYRPDDMVSMLERAGFRMLEQWVAGDEGFALTLVEAR